MKIIALIPARGGSKRLPRKNIKMLANKPLINWTIDTALNLPCLLDVIVSTDDLEIASIAKSAGASIPWIRPSELASDNATSAAVAIHALEMYEITNGPIDGLLLLQPTTPFRNIETIMSGIELFEKFGDTVIGVSPTGKHNKSGFQIINSKLVPFPEQTNDPHFDFLEKYQVNGSFYLISPRMLRIHQTFFNGSIRPLIVDSFKFSIDIDTEIDFNVAQNLLKSEVETLETKNKNFP